MPAHLRLQAGKETPNRASEFAYNAEEPMTWADQGLHLRTDLHHNVRSKNVVKDRIVGVVLMPPSLTQSVSAGLTLANDIKLAFEDSSGQRLRIIIQKAGF